MKRVHFDSKGPVKWHYFFWQPWGCGGCLWRSILFMVLLAIFLFLLSQFRQCTDDSVDATLPDRPVSEVIPPINDEDIIDEGGRQVVANRLNVLFDSETGQAEYEQWCNRFHELYPGDEYRILFYDPNTKLMSIEVPAERRVEIMEALPGQIPDIPFMVFDESVMETGETPNDPVFRNAGHAYYFDMMKIPDAWNITMGSNDVTVAVVDSYFDLENVEFASTEIVEPYSVANGNSDVSLPSDYNAQRPNPVYAHGSMVAGMALGATGNGRSSAGVAPRCRFMPVSLGHRFGCLAMLQGILYAINKRAQVINISAGLAFTEEVAGWPVEQQIAAAGTELLAQENVWHYVYDMAQRNYVTLVWAAGNEDVFTALDASKRGDNIIKVSSVDATMHKADFSNFGNFADRQIYESTVSAPGVQVPGIVPGTEGYMLVDGTSFSSPIVAGTVGLMKSVDPTLNTEEIISILKNTGLPVTGSTTIGPIVQTGPAVEAVYNTISDFAAVKNSITRGSGDRYKFCMLGYLDIADSTALPPIVTVELEPTSANRGRLLYSSNRENLAPVDAAYTAAANGNDIVLTVSAAAGDGEMSFGAARITLSADDVGKALVSGVDADWFHHGTPFFIKANS